MDELHRLEELLLLLGLEDEIPLAEAVEDAEGVLDATAAADPVGAVSRALTALLHRGRIQVLAGPWDGEPSRFVGDAAVALLADRANYAWDAVDDGSARVYFVNSENLLE